MIHQCHGFFSNLAKIDLISIDARSQIFFYPTVVVFELRPFIWGVGTSKMSANCKMFYVQNTFFICMEPT